MPSGKILTTIIMGFIAIYVGAQLIPELWYDIARGDKYTNACPNATGALTQECTSNGTTKMFLEMVPWMSAIGLMVTAVTIFLVRKR